MATTWNPSDKTASITLSGGNNIATTSGVDQGVRATNAFGSKTYCETKIGHADETLSTIATTAFNWATMSGGQGSSLVDFGGGTLALLDWIAGAPITTFSGSLAANDIIGWALDGTKVYISKNGTWILGNPAAGTGFATLTAGTYLPAARLYSTGGSKSVTLQADTTTYSPPTGFTIIGGGGSSPQTLTGTLFTDTDAFGAGSISVGPVTLTGTLFSDGDSFGAGVVSQGGSTQTLTGTLFSDSDAFGSGVITTGPVTLTGTLFSDTDSFGAGTITRGAVTLTGTLFSDSDSFGAGTVSVGPVTLTGTLYQDADQFGAGSLSVGSVTITGTLYSDPDSFGAGSISQVSPQTITGTLFVDGDTFGAGRVSAAGGLHGSSPRARRRGRVGRLDEELRQRLLAEEEDRIAAQIAAIEQDDDPEPADFARLAELETALAINRASMAVMEAHAARVRADEAARVAEEEDEDAALEAILLAA